MHRRHSLLVECQAIGYEVCRHEIECRPDTSLQFSRNNFAEVYYQFNTHVIYACPSPQD